VRRVLIALAIVIAVVAAISISWIWGGRQISLWLDRFATAEIKTLALSSIVYEGADTAGFFRMDEIILGTTAPDNRPFPISIRSDAQGNFVLSKGDKSFPVGKPRSNNSSAGREFAADPDDELVLTIRRSVLSWPTPFDFNFMTGHSPSWKRHCYYHLIWTKKSGPKLIMLWRYEQYFYSGDGWTSGFMTHEGSTGLIRVDIEK
jgi:hypothetical protein